ncbi:EAL domain-containing protein [uncultured Marinobacter sp.]|uniref:sensor domain-containing phosphodiesterase n=1 Tax=uncultured Marinobacter sp. TaxID=187379 RepID=UPI0030DDAD40
MINRQFLAGSTAKNLPAVAQYHQLMLDLSMSFINLPVERVEQATHQALARMALFFEADRAYVFEYDFNRTISSNTHEWCGEGIEPMIDHLQNLPIGLELVDWVDAHREGKPFIVRDVDQLVPGRLRDILEPQGIKSLLTAPLMDGDACIGFVGFDSVRKERLFAEGEYDLLSLFANLLVSIEQRKQTVDELSHTRDVLALANQRSLNILDGTHAAVYVADIESHEVLFVNRYSRELMGDVVGKTCWQAIQGNESGPCDFCTNPQLLNTDGTPAKPVTWEHYNPTLDRWFHITDQAIPWEDGHYVRMEIALDITERKAAESALKHRTDELTRVNMELGQLATVFTHAHEGISITDPEGTIIQVNDALCRMSGYQREELIGNNPRLLKSGRHVPEFYSYMWNMLLQDGHWSGEVWNRNKSGELYAVSLTISRVQDQRGKVLHYVALATDITEQMQHQEQLERIAHYDAITELPNRIQLARELKQAMAQASRHQSRIAIAYLDLDGFKMINDKYGHDVGDHLLAKVARNMKGSLRAEDTLARLGGDEFVAVFTSVDTDQALNAALKRLLQAAAMPVDVEGFALHVSASLGVTLYPQSDPQDADQLLRQADQAMYQAKLSGKNRFMLFDTQHHQAIVGQHERISLIEKALHSGEFVLYYQPKVNMRTGSVIGVEALVRWQHRERGLLPPAEFLPVIQNHPLSISLDAWVLGEALAQINQWKQDHGCSLPISINLSAMTLQQGKFVEILKHRLSQWPECAASRLEIEILESSALDDIGAVIEMIQVCRELGVRFALDDFGVGYSSLTYLKRLPANTLKIDQSFVRDMLSDPDDLAILKGILGLAQVFERDVIAEGVETIAHGECLLDLGCDCAQGYGIARPMPAEQVIPWLESWVTPASWLNREKF